MAEGKARQRALNLVNKWYRYQLADDLAQYRADRQKVSVQVNRTVQTEPAHLAAKWDKRITADGKPTRPAVRASVRLSQGLDVNARGNHQADPYIAYTRRCMRLLAKTSPTARAALEMHAAGWTVAWISQELDCSGAKARELVNCGLAAVAMYQQLG